MVYEYFYFYKIEKSLKWILWYYVQYNINISVCTSFSNIKQLQFQIWLFQTINVPVVIHGETRVSGNLDVQTINGNNLSSFVDCSQTHHIHTNLVLENITVNGHVAVNKLINNSIDFKELENSVVKKTGKQTIAGNMVSYRYKLIYAKICTCININKFQILFSSFYIIFVF